MVNDILLLIFNKLLELNSGSQKKLSNYNGKSFILNIVGLQLKALINEDGKLSNCLDLTEAEVSTCIIIPMAAATFLVNQDKLELYRQIEIRGDKNFATDFLEILSKLNFAGVYAQVSPLNAVLLQQLESIFKLIKDYLAYLSKTMSLSLSEYLVYETGDIVSRHKIEQFNSAVDELKEKTALLEKKIQKLVGKKL